MGVTNSNKEISLSNIDCGGRLQVRLSLTAEPNITSNPVDIVLLLDRSGSMSGTPLESLKVAVNKFIDIIDEATDSSADGQIGSGSRIGIVSFSETATQDTGLITSVDELKSATDALSAGGSTNHADAFTKGLALFDPSSTNAKIMIIFTDGVTTAGGDPNTVATAAKAQGVVIYSIGLDGNGGLDEQALRDWASDPDSAYVAIAPDASDLEDLFEDLAENISNPGATNIAIIDRVSPCFRIVTLTTPTKGSATLLDSQTVKWEIDELGVNASEGAAFEFTVEHIGPCTGDVAVNESIEYSDNEGNVVSFPSPVINVECETVITEPCPTAVDYAAEGCSDTIVFDAGDIQLDSIGRIVMLDVTLQNICPGKRVALAILLYEVDENDIEYKRGIKTMTVPAHNSESCRDILIRCVKFVLPEDLDLADTPNALCNVRNLRAKFIANYIDNDFECCDSAEE